MCADSHPIDTFFPLIFSLLTGSILFGWSKWRHSCFCYPLDQMAALGPGGSSVCHKQDAHWFPPPHQVSADLTAATFTATGQLKSCDYGRTKVRGSFPWSVERVDPVRGAKPAQTSKTCRSWWWVTQQRWFCRSQLSVFPQRDPRLWFVWELCPSLPLPWLMLMCLKSITCK